MTSYGFSGKQLSTAVGWSALFVGLRNVKRLWRREVDILRQRCKPSGDDDDDDDVVSHDNLKPFNYGRRHSACDTSKHNLVLRMQSLIHL